MNRRDEREVEVEVEREKENRGRKERKRGRLVAQNQVRERGRKRSDGQAVSCRDGSKKRSGRNTKGVRAKQDSRPKKR